MRTSNLLLTATVALAVVAIASCCKKKEEETTATTEDAAPAASTEAPAEEPAPINPDWKTKCPDAERPLGGTVTAVKNLVVHKAPKDDAEHIGSIGPGTWVNLLGSKQNWYCIDYPCEVGKLCPGWVEERYTQRKTTTDAGVKDAAVEAAAAAVDAAAAAVDAGVAKPDAAAAAPDAAPATTTTTPPGTKAPPGGRPPPIRKKP